MLLTKYIRGHRNRRSIFHPTQGLSNTTNHSCKNFPHEVLCISLMTIIPVANRLYR